MTKDMNPHELGAFGAYAAEAIANQIADDRDHWKARAERAEAEAAELRNRVMVLERAFQNSHEVNEHTGDEIRALRAELEAARAGQGWRPVTEPPTEAGEYLVYDADGRVFYESAGITQYRVAKWDGRRWRSSFEGLIDYWQPLPAAPDADAGEE